MTTKINIFSVKCFALKRKYDKIKKIGRVLIMSKRKFYQKKRFVVPFVIALALIFMSIIGAIYSSLYYTTVNAYVKNYFVEVVPKISSKVIELNFQNGVNVKKGEI